MNASPIFRIEPATATDLRGVAEVHSRAVIEAYPKVLPPGVFDPEYVAPAKMEKEYRELFASFGPKDTLLKAHVHGTIVGTCTCGDDTQLHEEGTGYIQRVYVDPKWWNRGIGTALVTRALDLLMVLGFSKFALQVLENNAKARDFYEKRGWEFERAVRVKDVGTELRYVKRIGQ